MKSDDPNDGQLLLSIGALLASERQKRDIPIEKAAKETRMRAQRIRDMENDDLSHFTNPSYARMFIIAYAKYLGIPMDTVREFLPERGEAATEGYNYVSSLHDDLPSIRPHLSSRPSRGGLIPTLIALTLLALIAGGGFLGYYLYVNLPRITARSEPAPPPPAPINLASAEEELLSDGSPIAELRVSDSPLAATVSPTPAVDPTTATLETNIAFIPAETAPPEDISSTESISLEDSLPAPESEPVAPTMEIADPAAAADREFLLQNPSPTPDAE